MSIQQKLTSPSRTKTKDGTPKSQLNITESDIQTIDGLSCHSGTCHIARSEFEVTSPIKSSATNQMF